MLLKNLKTALKSVRNRLSGTGELGNTLNRSLREMRDAMNFQFEQMPSRIAGVDARLGTPAESGLGKANVTGLDLDDRENRPNLIASHASIFRKFGPEKRDAPPGYHREYGGNIYSQDILTPSFSLTEEGYPAPSEELFEWIDLLESIDDAADSFVMAELGAGFARWLGAAACLLRRYKPMPFRLIGVEAEPVHFEWIKRYFSDNGLDWRDHHLVQAAVGGADGSARFVVGNAREWYGQAVVQRFSDYNWNYVDWPDARVVKVPMVSIETLLKDEAKVDYVHMDIQGSEAEVITNSHRVLSEKVKRMHVATHHREIEQSVYNMLRRERWMCVAAYPTQATVETPYGTVTFGDGGQSWINPRFFKTVVDPITEVASAQSRIS